MKCYYVFMELADSRCSIHLEGVVRELSRSTVNTLDILASGFYDECDDFREHILDLEYDDVPLGQREIINDDLSPDDVLLITAFDAGNRNAWPKGWDGETFGLNLKEEEAGR